MGFTAGALIDALLSKSFLSRCLKLGRGRSRRSAATRASGPSRRSTVASPAPRSAVSVAAIIRSSRSTRERLAICPPRQIPQVLPCAPLKLLHGAFAALQFLRHLALVRGIPAAPRANGLQSCWLRSALATPQRPPRATRIGED